jgi:hypothetical protein
MPTFATRLRTLPVMILPLVTPACVYRDIDQKLWQMEQTRMQRDILENERLRLWLDYRGVTRGRR